MKKKILWDQGAKHLTMFNNGLTNNDSSLRDNDFKCPSVFFSVLIVSINCLSVRLASYVQNFFTAAKLFIILVIVGAGVVLLAQGWFSCPLSVLDEQLCF